ncbi:MAG TPA: hypothetical protein VES60_01765 [Nakamurella sp.]|nr:hypothetical protein [Nakamurella sp.]
MKPPVTTAVSSPFSPSGGGLHTAVWGRTMSMPNVDRAWTRRSAEVLMLDDGLLGAAGFGDLATRLPDHVCFTEGVHTRIGLPRGAARGLKRKSRLPRGRAADSSTKVVAPRACFS